jgi:hypothetical protein
MHQLFHSSVFSHESFRCAAVLTCADGVAVVLSSAVDAQWHNAGLPTVELRLLAVCLYLPGRKNVKPLVHSCVCVCVFPRIGILTSTPRCAQVTSANLSV